MEASFFVKLAVEATNGVSISRTDRNKIEIKKSVVGVKWSLLKRLGKQENLAPRASDLLVLTK